EQECDVLLCTVHVVRTWMKNIYHGLTLNKMIHAMHKKTQVGCEEIVRDAINTCSQYSPLLLQITSTNPLESYHSELKAKIFVQYGFIETAINFRTKRISLANTRPEIFAEIHKFPFPFQKLITEEVHAVSKRLEVGKCAPNLASAECSCRFFNQYMLPCRHIFREQLCGSKILTSEAWGNFQQIFEESGMEVYQTRGIVEVPVIQKLLAEKAAEKSQSRMYELFERTRDCYYRLSEKNIDEASRFIENLERILEPAINH
ncbi:9095_t:CDS:2, partial [Gigaspora rosea]